MFEATKCNKSAFTLIEVTIALLILAVGLVGILTLFPVGFDASGRAANLTEATFLAQEKIEELKRDGYDAALGKNGVNGEFTNYPHYEYGIAVDEITLDSLCKITVNVYWPNDAATQRNVELTTYMAKYEP